MLLNIEQIAYIVQRTLLFFQITWYYRELRVQDSQVSIFNFDLSTCFFAFHVVKVHNLNFSVEISTEKKNGIVREEK